MKNLYILTTEFNKETHVLVKGRKPFGSCYMLLPLTKDCFPPSAKANIITRGTEEEMNEFRARFLRHIDERTNKSSPEEIAACKALKTSILEMSVYSKPTKQEPPFFYSQP